MRTKSLMLAAVLVASTALADTMSFSPGALIIPEQANFQTPCGSVSAYGLVWRILQSNEAGHYNAGHPVTVYWMVSSTKGSPNRCNPTNVSMPPAPYNADAGWADPAWNDGCDFYITADGGQPVTLINPSNISGSWPGLFADSAVPFYNNSSDAYPHYADAGTGSLKTSSQPGWNTVQYMGGAFVIDATDAQNVFNFLKSGDSAVPAGTGTAGALSRYTDRTSCTCSGSSASATCHFVNIHQAKVTFSGEVGKRMNQVPPKLALVDTASFSLSDGGIQNCNSFSFGSNTSCSNTDVVAVGILDQYLANAGLLVTTNPDGGSCAPNCSIGCPQGTFAPGCVGSGKNGSSPGNPKSGLIYDVFDAKADLISTSTYPYGLLNKTTGGKLDYKVFWAPHWEATGVPSYGQYWSGNPSGGADQRENAFLNIAHFTDIRGTGLMAECASIDTYETGYDTSQSLQSPSGLNNTSTRFQFSNAVTMNGISGWTGRNCSDPDYGTAWTGKCTFYPNPGNVFSQIGDFTFTSIGGHLANMKPDYSKGSTYNGSVQRLATSWRDYAPGQFPDGGTYSPLSDTSGSDSAWDFATMSYKDGNTNKATIVYIGGHDYGTDVMGNRMILNTLFALGADPSYESRSASVPVGFINEFGSDATGSGTRLLEFTSVYKSVTGYGSAPGVQTFSPATSSAWVFPYYPGDFTAHSLGGASGALASGENDLVLSATSDSVYTWDANLMLSAPPSGSPIAGPGNRNIFTYFGGFVSADTTKPQVNKAPSKVLQVGWVPENVDGHVLSASVASGPHTGCVDVMKLGSPAGFVNGLVVDSTLGDGICDLQEGLERMGTGDGMIASLGPLATNKLVLDGDVNNAAQMIQRVRGYCVANASHSDGDGTAPNLSPADTDCNDPDAENKAHLGGLVFSAPAIVPYSPNVKDVGGKRPTVAYSAGYDGMLHAFYVAGGAGYKGVNGATDSCATSSIHFPHQSPANGSGVAGCNDVGILSSAVTSRFNTPWIDATTNDPSSIGTGFTPPPPMTELWAYMPASQLPSLKNNNTKVDSAPVVQDVYGDFGFTGVKEWHTVLVGSVGSEVNGTYSEMYALDITNPLKPVLLWDLVGAWDAGGTEPTGSYPPGFILANTNTGYTATYGVGSAWKWDLKNAEFDDDPTHTDSGRSLTALYDYGDMGGAQGLALVTFTPIGGQPMSLVFANTNAGKDAPFNDGQEIYGIDAVTGQLAWQTWLRFHYGDDDSDHHHGVTGNAVPPSASLYYDDFSAGYNLMVGDQLGRVWALDPSNGESVYLMTPSPKGKHGRHSGCGGHSAGHGCACPALISDSHDDDPQPVSTLVAIAKIPNNPPPNAPTGAFAGHGGEEVIVFGTGGYDWAYHLPGGKHVQGRLHVGLIRSAVTCDDSRRKNNGMFDEPSGFPWVLPDDISVAGDISVSGQEVWFSTLNQPLKDLFAPVTNVTGAFYALDLGGGCDSTLGLNCSVAGGMPIGQWGTFTRGSYGGGPTVLHDGTGPGGTDYVVGTQTTRIDTLAITNSPTVVGKASSNISLSVNGFGVGKNGGKGIIQWMKRRLR